MQDFLKEWGPAIITAVAVLTIVGLVALLAPSIQTGMNDVITKFGEQATVPTTSGAGGFFLGL